ncbi:HTTM domain-containing protein [Chryseobacterium sp. S0630]|uniref:HTTM domain-containing protein n=1 Tax=Chryseobacterium sp. S0630 TaxID=2957803 RepID=UPI00209EB047|nr:HTTM domain-containing protein [Chryseobacterium sp. S0630]MCP1298073.1 HTTM domain-containing protein [Chryseobacterium sp. S0630]
MKILFLLMNSNTKVMKNLNAFYTKIENFFFKQDNQTEFLSFFRIAIGIVILLQFTAVLPDFEKLFSSSSVIPQDIMSVFIPDWLITFSKMVSFFQTLGIEESTTIAITKVSFITLCILIITGLYSRISAFFLLILQIALLKGSSFFAYGADFFTSMSLFYLILFPADQHFSLRNCIFRRKPGNTNITPVKRLFQIHISIAYFFSGLDKALGFNWWNGESIWKAIHLPYSNRDLNIDFSWLIEHSYILSLMGWSTIIIEMCYPFFIWYKPTQKTWLFLTISMHIGIALVLNLYYFSAIMIVWNITNFYFEQPAKKTVSSPKKKISADYIPKQVGS